MDIFRFYAIAVAIIVIFLTLKAVNDQFSVYVKISGGIFILFYVCSRLSPIFSFVQELADRSGVNSQYFKTILKGMSVCYLCEFIVESCKDCGLPGWGDKVELACRCSLLVMTIPLFEDFLEVIMNLLE